MQYGIGNLAQRPEFGLGDFISDVFKPVRKVVNKVVPRELQPILPVIAGAFLGPMAGSLFSGLGAGAGLAGFLGAGTSSALTQALTGSGQIDPTSTLLSAGIGGIQGARIPKGFQDTTAATMPGQGGTGLMPGQGPNVGRTVFAQPGTEAYKAAMDQAGFFDKALMTAKEYTGSTSLNPMTGRLQYDRGPESFLKGATAFGLPATSKMAAEEQIKLDEEERQGQIESQADKRKKRKIYIDFVQRAGFSQEEAERMADGAGFNDGGRVGFDMGGMSYKDVEERYADGLTEKEFIRFIELTPMERMEEMKKAGVLRDDMAIGGRIKAQDGIFTGAGNIITEIFGQPQQPEIGEIDARFRPKSDELDQATINSIASAVDNQRRRGVKNTNRVLEEIQKLAGEEGYTLNSKEIERIIQFNNASNQYMAEERDRAGILGRRTDSQSGFNEGGVVPGLPRGKQVDAREGTFIPMGGAKRADDVPAMLSVNEFVLNDNAVAGLGKMLTGNPDPRAGARALYKIQDQLEAMVV